MEVNVFERLGDFWEGCCNGKEKASPTKGEIKDMAIGWGAVGAVGCVDVQG
jgi:hypothetical protein